MLDKAICKYCKKPLRRSKKVIDLTDIKYHDKCKREAKEDLKGLCFLINNFYDDLEIKD